MSMKEMFMKGGGGGEGIKYPTAITSEIKIQLMQNLAGMALVLTRNRYWVHVCYVTLHSYKNQPTWKNIFTPRCSWKCALKCRAFNISIILDIKNTSTQSFWNNCQWFGNIFYCHPLKCGWWSGFWTSKNFIIFLIFSNK